VSWIGDPLPPRLLPLGKHSASGTRCGSADWERESGRSMAIHAVVQSLPGAGSRVHAVRAD
jgi:hypothetical protein